MGVFNGGYKPDTHSGLMKLFSVKQLIFCLGQSDDAAHELDAYSMLGISMMLEEAGYEIEQCYEKILKSEEAAEKRHNKLRAELAALKEIQGLIGASDISRILEADQEVNHAADE